MLSGQAFAPVIFARFRFFLLCLLVSGTAGLLMGCRSALPACEDAFGCIVIRPNEPVQIGYLLALSGEAAVLGEEALQGVELAVADRNGTVLSHNVVLVGVDTACSPTTMESAFQNLLTNEQLVGVIGPSCSDEARVAIPLTTAAGVVMLSPSATAPDLLTNLGGAFFRLAAANDHQAAVAAQFAYRHLGARTAATVHDGSEYTISLTRQFVQVFTELGGEIVVQERAFAGQSVVDELVAPLFAAQPDVLFMPLFGPEANLLVNRLREVDSSVSVAIIGADNLLAPEFPLSAGAAVEGMYLTGTAVTGAAYEQFIVRWINAFDAEPVTPYHAHAYDAANLLLDALTQVAHSNNDGALLIGRRALQQAIASANNYPALTGMLTCHSNECGSSQAFGVYILTATEINGTNWPPPVIWTMDEIE